jgi:hypothetical protein
VTTLRSDINTGNTRDCQAAIEDLSDSLLELEESDVPANCVVRLRAEQAGLRKSILRVYHIQRLLLPLPAAAADRHRHPVKVGQERTEDDASLFLLTEFMVHAQAAGTAAVVPPEDVEAHAAAIEEQLVEDEEAQAAELAAEAGAARARRLRA